MFAGDSYTVGYGNTGGTTMCNMTVCSPVGICSPELDSQNSAIAWGPLTAANFSADYEVIAWSGAEVADYSVAEVFEASLNLPAWIGENLYPLDGDLFMRQVAADNSSMVSNFSSWVPQGSMSCCTQQRLACTSMHTCGALYLGPPFGVLL